MPNSTINIDFIDKQITPVESSFAGGNTLTITGKLFNPLTSYVEVCGFNCKID
jgi:hypothetical protein